MLCVYGGFIGESVLAVTCGSKLWKIKLLTKLKNWFKEIRNLPFIFLYYGLSTQFMVTLIKSFQISVEKEMKKIK